MCYWEQFSFGKIWSSWAELGTTVVKTACWYLLKVFGLEKEREKRAKLMVMTFAYPYILVIYFTFVLHAHHNSVLFYTFLKLWKIAYIIFCSVVWYYVVYVPVMYIVQVQKLCMFAKFGQSTDNNCCEYDHWKGK